MSSQSKAIELLYQHHDEFISAAHAIFGNSWEVKSYAEDLVQETYIYLMRYDDLYEKVVVDGRATKGYFFFTLRHLIARHLDRNVKRNSYIENYGDRLESDEELLAIELDESEVSESYEEFRSAMVDFLRIQLVDDKDWFHLRVFEKYLDSGLTYEELAESVGIGTQTVYKSVKKCKEILQEGFYLDYKTFLNGR
jgi:RNA polymerase sigma factor (sigma-70 family)